MAGLEVQSLEAIQQFRTHLLIFVERARNAVDEAKNDVNKTEWWLRYDRLPHWQREYRRRDAKLHEARGNLMGAKMTKSSETQFGERQAVIKAELALEEATEKLRRIKVWLRKLEGDARTTMSQCQRLSNTLDIELPKGAVALRTMIDQLEAYLDEHSPTAGLELGGVGAASDGPESAADEPESKEVSDGN